MTKALYPKEPELQLHTSVLKKLKAGLNPDGTLRMSEEEKVFYQVLKDTGNTCEAWRHAYPEKAATLAAGTIRNAASLLVKRLGVQPLVRKNKIKYSQSIFNKSERYAATQTTGEGVVRFAEKQFQAGAITDEELWNTMVNLSRYAVQETVRLNATERLKTWHDAIKSDIAANSLGDKDIADLFIAAMSALPHDKYMRVLLGIRAARQSLIKKRTEVIDVDQEIDRYRSELASRAPHAKETEDDPQTDPLLPPGQENIPLGSSGHDSDLAFLVDRGAPDVGSNP